MRALSGMDGATRLEELVTWQRMRELEDEVLKVAVRPALVREDKFRKQLTDAAGSATRNVAEGFARYNPGEFARFLDVSRASATEVRSCLLTARTAGYISEADFLKIDHLAIRGLQTLARFQRYLRSDAARQNARRYRYARQNASTSRTIRTIRTIRTTDIL